MRVRVLATAAAALTFAGAFFLALPAPTRAAAPRVAIIVGPVGDGLTQRYIELADDVAAAASAAGAFVAKAYSPSATPANVLAAVAGANIVIYYGHGSGFPNPYSATLDPNGTNGWGLQGPNARGTHEHSWADGTLRYYGEAWITANARPAPGFVMIYSNACYAPGASEGWDVPATETVARERVGYYSRGPLSMGAAAYFATDVGATSIVSTILRQPHMTYGDIFKSHRIFEPAGLRTFWHNHIGGGAQTWLHHSARSDGGEPNYWYAYAGNPALTPAGSGGLTPPTGGPPPPPAAVDAPPAVIGRAPVAGAVGVVATTLVQAQFNEPVTGVGTGNFVLRNSTGTVVPAAVTYDGGARMATLRPVTPLYPGTYSVGLSGSIRDLAGQSLPWTAWSFSTASATPPAPPPASGPTLTSGTSYSPPRALSFQAGTHTGYQFNSAGVVTASKPYTLSRASSASAGERRTIAGQSGVWFRMTNGVWAGYWVRESPAIYLPGVASNLALAAPRTTAFAAGTHTGYQFSATGAVTAAKPYTLSRPSSATADRRAIVNGVPYLRMMNGIWAGWWVRESAAVRLV